MPYQIKPYYSSAHQALQLLSALMSLKQPIRKIYLSQSTSSEIRYQCRLNKNSIDLLVSVVNVVTAASPDPLLPEVLGSLGLRTSARGQLPVSAAARDAVNDSGRGHGVGEGGLFGGWKLKECCHVLVILVLS